MQNETENPARLLGRMIRESFPPHLIHPDFERQIEAWAAFCDEIIPAPDFNLTGKRDTFRCQAKGE